MLANSSGLTPLEVAVVNGHVNVLDALITKARNEVGKNLLFLSCENDQCEMLQSLIDNYGCDPTCTDEDGNSLLHIASLHNKPDIIELLVKKYKCSTNVLNSAQQIPMHVAIKCGHIEACNIFMDMQVVEVAQRFEHQREERLQQKLTQTELSVRQTEQKLQLADQRIKELEEEYQEATETITKLEGNMARMHRTNNQDVEQSVCQAEKRALHFEELHQEAVKTIVELQGNVTRIEQNRQMAEQRVQEAEQSAHQFKQRTKLLEEENQEATESITKLKDSAARAEQRVHEAEQTVHQAELRAKCLDEQNQKAAKTITELMAGVEQDRQLEQRKCKIEQNMHQMEQKALPFEELHREATKVVTELEGNVAIAEEATQTAQQREQESEQRVKQLEKQNQGAKKTIIELGGEIGRIKQQNHEYRRRLMELQLAVQARNEWARNPREQPFWIVSGDEVTITPEEIGRGGWGKVNIALFRGQNVAAKTIFGGIASPQNIQLFTGAMYLSSTVRHPNLLLFIGATTGEKPIILTELMETSLRKLFKRNPQPEALPQDVTTSILLDVARGLNYLHLMTPDPLIHGDISSSNILLESSTRTVWKAKISDFGLTNFLSQAKTAGSGNIVYAAPEAYNPHNHTPKMDVFSFGVLIVEMCTGRLPPHNASEREQVIKRISWQESVNLIKQCTQTSRDKRPSMSDILKTLDPNTRGRGRCRVS